MTKRKKELSSNQLNLFDTIKKVEELTRQTQQPVAGTLDIDAQLRHAVSDDIRHAHDATSRLLSRNEIAAKMSDLTGREITASMLNNWTAESHERHYFPLQYLPAFVIATGGRRAFEVVSRASGLFALPGESVIRAEITKLGEQIKRLKKEENKYKTYLKIKEGD